jgi:hypothetical protein
LIRRKRWAVYLYVAGTSKLSTLTNWSKVSEGNRPFVILSADWRFILGADWRLILGADWRLILASDWR